MKILVVEPGASTSTVDVAAGLRYGLTHHGVTVVPYRLDQRIAFARNWLNIMWRQKKKEYWLLRASDAWCRLHQMDDRDTRPSVEDAAKDLETVFPDRAADIKADVAAKYPKPQMQDVMYHASVGAMEMAIRHQVDVVLIVSAMLFHTEVVVMMKRAGLRVVVLFTESPYDEEPELRLAELVDGCWTMERTSLPKFLAVNPRSGYLQHAWHPERHFVSARSLGEIAHHDVVFVGSGFPERITWFNAIDWTGIDLGLYGTWKGLGLNAQVSALVRGAQVSNEKAAALYRRARISLNIYRSLQGYGRKAVRITHAESLSPRAYELAACGAFHLSDGRAEVREVFGDLVPTFSTPKEAEQLIRQWLADPDGRARISAALPACVAESSWVQRATTVIGDLQSLLAQRAA